MRVSHPLRLLLSLAALLVAAPSASAAPAGPSCPGQADLEQPFARFADPAAYFLTPGGAFETGPWSGGKVVAGNEPYRVRRGGERDKRSLAIAASTATSPSTCIGLEDPTIRFFAVRTAGPATATLGVSVTYVDIANRTQTLPLAPVGAAANGAWVVTAPIPLLANVAVAPKVLGVDPVYGRPTSAMTFSFTPAPGSSWSIDDVYVDPYQRN